MTARGVWHVVWVLALVVVGLLVWRVLAPREREPRVDALAGEEVVFDWSEDACGRLHIPDLPVRAFRDEEDRVHLVLAHFVNRQMVGPSLDRLEVECPVILASDSRPDPRVFDDREWLAAPYTPDGRTVYALVHNEYQGHRHAGRCLSGEYLPCWYNALTLAVSTDGGRTYRHTPPPSHLVAAPVTRYAVETGPVGVFRPSNVVHRQEDGHYYALVQVQERGGEPSGACLLRTRRLGDPDAWRAWDGESFTVRLVSPYRGARPTPCRFVARDEIAGMTESVTFNTYLDRYVLVGISGRHDASRSEVVWGIYYSLSENLVDWTPRRLLLEVPTRSQASCGEDAVSYPAILDPGSPSRNFETAGRRAYLYFTRSHYQGCELTLDRDLVRVPVEFSK